MEVLILQGILVNHNQEKSRKSTENGALDSECGARPFTRAADCVAEKKKREQAPAVQAHFLTEGMVAEKVRYVKENFAWIR